MAGADPELARVRSAEVAAPLAHSAGMTKTALIAQIQSERIVGMHVLADWWFDRFQNPRHDNGDRSRTGEVTSLLAGMVAAQHPTDASDEARAKFRAAVIAAMQPEQPVTRQRADGKTCSDVYWHDTLSVDYGPSGALREAMEACGIDTSRAPWKTHSCVYGGGLVVELSDGYRAKHQMLYVAPVLDLLVQLTAEELKALTPAEYKPESNGYEQDNLDLNYAVTTVAVHYASTVARDRIDVPYVLEGIQRARALAQQQAR